MDNPSGTRRDDIVTCRDARAPYLWDWNGKVGLTRLRLTPVVSRAHNLGPLKVVYL
jgi:hypothetical protein